MIRAVYHRRIPIGFTDTGFQVIGNDNLCYALEELEHVYMCGDPVLLILGEKPFHIGILAIGERGDKHGNGDMFSGVAVNNRRGRSGPVDLRLVSRFSRHMHRRPIFLGMHLVVITELGVLKRNLFLPPAVLTILGPQELE